MSSLSHLKHSILRESSCSERIFYLYHRLGIQSNVLVSAKYAKPGATLTRHAVLTALQAVVTAHPMMRTVGISRPSKRRKTRRCLDIAMMNEIDLEACVEFLDEVDEDSGLTATIERAHNEWDHLDDIPTKPLFKLIVVNRTDVHLVYHHMMADGMSGYVFHRTFLAALNRQSTALGTPCHSYIVHSDPSTDQIPFEWSQLDKKTQSRDKRWNPSKLDIVLSQSAFLISQLVFSSRFLFSKLPSSTPYLRSTKAIAPPPQRTLTRVVSGYLTKCQISRILQACRRQETTFTPLLVTVLSAVLSTEYNTKASFASTRFALDMRPHLPFPSTDYSESHGTMFNCTSGMARVSRVGKHRQAVRKFEQSASSTSSMSSNEKEPGDIEDAKIWELTRKYKEWMTKSTVPAVRAVRASRGMNTELEHTLNRIMPFAGLVLTSTTLVSNLGVFVPDRSADGTTGVVGNGWDIKDIHFSAAASNGAQGSQGPIFNVSGLRDGRTNINAVFENGIISREEARKILDMTIARLVSLA